ncbi:unnamed protein product [Durusdinium trenchii]|uniref:Uncharacterized protein n=1 Tax=Durusdinium trenchii TaxID=1381693 RepID=A0ABP0S9B1_9DINO
MDENDTEDPSEEVTDLGVQKYQTVQEESLEDVQFPKDVVEEAQQAWSAFTMAATKEATGEALYSAIFYAAPALQGLFKIPRPTMAARFMNGINAAVAAAHKPSTMRVQAEALGFQHFDIEVTALRGDIFREAILDVLDLELGGRFSTKAKLGLAAIINYLIGACVFVRREYADRIHVLQQSWDMANHQAVNATEMAQEDGLFESSERDPDEQRLDLADMASGKDVEVPTTFAEMFHFNAAVMGFNSKWMNSILQQMDDLVSNAAASYRLTEECSVLSLVLAQHSQPVLSEFKAVLLASLRSLVAKEWSTQHEVAWNWFWDNIVRLLKAENVKPQVQMNALELFITQLSPADLTLLYRNIYKKFFELAPSGQDYFKQSLARLDYIADQILVMSLEMYKDPRGMVRRISALGLRHVGYAIPTDLFPPFVTAAIDVVRSMTTVDQAESAFRWSLTLVSKILVRSINEGSTVVMKAVNTNQGKSLRRAVALAPRGQRNMQMLNVEVGTESISPLYWAIETGSHNVAKAMIIDLLTIRADRDNYYYGNEALFTRHPEIIEKLCLDAPVLLWPLLDGLIWRSRFVSQGTRRVNYYIQHLVQDADGNMNQALQWMADTRDPKLITHPIVVVFSDLMWSRLVMYHFLTGRVCFFFTLIIFVLGQALDSEERVVIFICRAFIYVGVMLYLLIRFVRLWVAALRARDFVRITRWLSWPKFLCSLKEISTLMLLASLITMCTQEPIFWCFNHQSDTSGPFSNSCPELVPEQQKSYQVVSGFTMLLYWLLVMDVSIFSMHIFAYYLVIFQVLTEIALFMTTLFFLVMAFATSLNALKHQIPALSGIDSAALTLLLISLKLFSAQNFAELEASVWVFVVVCIFMVLVTAFLLNLLVAQVSESYSEIVQDMYGYARLDRANVTMSTIRAGSKSWQRFLTNLNFAEKLEFNEGDIGLAGGVSLAEPASDNPTPVDRILRFGGSTSPSKPWPEEGTITEEDRFARLEKLIMRMGKNRKKKKRERENSNNESESARGSEMSEDTDDDGEV